MSRSSSRSSTRSVKSLPYESAQGCPAGFHKRKAYTVKKTGKYVAPRCVRSTTVYAESRKNYTRRVLAKSSQRLKGLSPRRLGLTKRCPKGYILRKPYVRKFQTSVRSLGYTVHRGNKTYRAYPRKNKTVVKASCIKDLGLPGSKPVFGPLRKGDLSKYGYNVKRTQEERHASLRKAVEEYGALGTFRKLNAVAKLSKRTAPEASKVFKADRDWVRSKFDLRAF